MRKYPIEALTSLQNSHSVIQESGIDVILKKTDTTQAGHIDTYEKSYVNPDPAQIQMPFPTDPMEVLNLIRNSFGCHNYNLNEREIYTKYESLTVDGREVGLWRYYLRRRQESLRPCLFYIHGGGWIAGSIYPVENPCKLVAELADSVVFNIDYTLAPDGHYPISFTQLWETLKHIYTNAESYGIDPAKIMVAGDSAGGNLTAALALKDRDEGTHMIAEQFMLYPAVVMGNLSAPGYIWTEDAYEVCEEDQKLIDFEHMLGRPAADEKANTLSPFESFYLPSPSLLTESYVSPMLSDSFDGLPKAVIATAEFDGLRQQGEFYAGQLARAGVSVKTLRYCGCFHAFLDRMGYVPQSEDICHEMAKELLSL